MKHAVYSMTFVLIVSLWHLGIRKLLYLDGQYQQKSDQLTASYYSVSSSHNKSKRASWQWHIVTSQFVLRTGGAAWYIYLPWAASLDVSLTPIKSYRSTIQWHTYVADRIH